MLWCISSYVDHSTNGLLYAWFRIMDCIKKFHIGISLRSIGCCFPFIITLLTNMIISTLICLSIYDEWIEPILILDKHDLHQWKAPTTTISCLHACTRAPFLLFVFVWLLILFILLTLLCVWFFLRSKISFVACCWLLAFVMYALILT